MNIFDGIAEIFNNLFSIKGTGWVIRNSVSSIDLDTFNGVAVEDDFNHTCVNCVALNNTVFKNNNKPDFFHRKCRCKNKKYTFKELKVIFDENKVRKYLFLDNNKSNMMKSMGYYPEDWKEVYDLIYSQAQENFKNGDYKLKYLNEYGQHFEIDFILPGKRDHIGDYFEAHMGCVALPFCKIKIATPLVKNN